MQNRDGGWAAFDRDNTAEFLCHVPFADHNAMIDPSSPDLTARVLESLASLGTRVGDAAVDRARRLFAAHTRSRRQLVRPLGRELHLRHLAGAYRIGGRRRADRRSSHRRRRTVADCTSTAIAAAGANRPTVTPIRDSAAKGRETASQTAWALLGLIAAGIARSSGGAHAACSICSSHQNSDGTWDETEFTGTGFPQVFYLRYHYYRIYFPLLALSRWAKAAGRRRRQKADCRRQKSECLRQANF